MSETYFRVRNWDNFQHYKDRNPPWIKLHFALLASEDWVMFDDASRVLAIACMLIASRNEGRVPNKPDYVRRVAYLNASPDFGPLVECGFLEEMQADASTALADASDSVSVSTSKNLDTTPTVQEEASTREDAVSVLSQTLDLERAHAVVEHRKRLRKPLTDHAAKLLAKKFAKCPSPNEAADAMIANGWQGFEPDWLENRRSQGPPTKDGWLELNRELNGYGNGPHDDRNQKTLPAPAGGVTLDIEAEEPGGAR